MDKTIRWLNVATGVTFMLGIILCMSFVIVNLHREASMTNRITTGDGLNIRVPAPGDVAQKGSSRRNRRPSSPLERDGGNSLEEELLVYPIL
jgi:hypothetical protein